MAPGSTWMTDYAEDVLAWMHTKELQHMAYNGNSPQLAMRGALVEFLRIVSERLKLSVATTHLSVYLLDRFMDAHHISDNQLRLTALTAILLAGTVTVAHFAEFYLMRGVTAGDTMEGATLAEPALARQSLWKATAHFLDISLQDQVFLQWRCSQVAAACVACGRLCCHLLPTWPVSLQATTGYHLQTLSQLMDLLFRLYESEDKASVCSTPDSGYGSRCSSVQGSPVSHRLGEV
nr:cyclin-J-like protein isoform X2 [Penaeus vannamei]